MNNIHSDKYNLAVIASESSSMAYTYLRKIFKRIFRYPPTIIYELCLLQFFFFLNVEIEKLTLFFFCKSVHFSYLSMVLRLTALTTQHICTKQHIQIKKV